MKEAFVDYNPRENTLMDIHMANTILEEYADQGFVLSVRQLYYQFVSRDLIPNTQQQYKRLAGIVADARKGGMIDWSYIEDRGRNLDKVATWNSPSEIVEACVRQYRRDRWADQPERVEVWVEKDALLGVIERAVQGLDVPFMSCRGYPSASMIYEARDRFDSDCLVLHLGDHDPSGIDATRHIQDELELYGALAEVKRVALTFDQVSQYAPPPNPAKETDSRFARYSSMFGDDCWELDALEPQVIVDLIRAEIEFVLDRDIWKRDPGAREQGARRDPQGSGGAQLTDEGGKK